jgi:hypothetical protein
MPFSLRTSTPSSSQASEAHTSLIQRIQTRHSEMVTNASISIALSDIIQSRLYLNPAFAPAFMFAENGKHDSPPFPHRNLSLKASPLLPLHTNNNSASTITSIESYSYRASIQVSYHRTPHNSPLPSPTPTQHRQNRERIFNGNPQVHTISPPIKESPRVIVCAGIVTESSAHQTPTRTPSYSSAPSLSRRGLDLSKIGIEVQVAACS